MASEAISTNEIFESIVYDTISADQTFLPENNLIKKHQELGGGASDSSSCMMRRCGEVVLASAASKKRQNASVQGRKKRLRRPKVCKNKEEAETQRMNHIVVERNRRKQMNQLLDVLRSLMPKSYVQRCDQASIVGGAIEYVKELEHLLQCLEAQKLLLPQQGGIQPPSTIAAATESLDEVPFAQFFAHPQYTWSQFPSKCVSKSKATAVADIEVTLIENHANLRILCRKNLRQLSKLVAGFQAMCLTILHLNVTTLDPLVLYSISAKVEEGCQVPSADEIAGAVHRMLRIIEEPTLYVEC